MARPLEDGISSYRGCNNTPHRNACKWMSPDIEVSDRRRLLMPWLVIQVQLTVIAHFKTLVLEGKGGGGRKLFAPLCKGPVLRYFSIVLTGTPACTVRKYESVGYKSILFPEVHSWLRCRLQARRLLRRASDRLQMHPLSSPLWSVLPYEVLQHALGIARSFFKRLQCWQPLALWPR